ncbi:hypothetical protein M422DRAFT_32596 [Sphaerobolus stellatus SS14]|uniref:Uncharacterized protein n=1 Tax=Sphaerobolus stellatus (strain SS14) TaxID=990650 RepID=A0A0C9VDT1_SPHS4|nr:hypothetical protein M422DRAFT_32596 [Sphaerobolus stellatus SS14]
MHKLEKGEDGHEKRIGREQEQACTNWRRERMAMSKEWGEKGNKHAQTGEGRGWPQAKNGERKGTSIHLMEKG